MLTAAASHASTTDVLERLADEVRSWPKVEPPDTEVPVRADLITASYVEIERLRARGQDLLETNNRYLQRARDAEAERDRLLSVIGGLTALVRHLLDVVEIAKGVKP